MDNALHSAQKVETRVCWCDYYVVSALARRLLEVVADLR